jgi:pyrroline-5-carboxylate reductase
MATALIGGLAGRGSAERGNEAPRGDAATSSDERSGGDAATSGVGAPAAPVRITVIDPSGPQRERLVRDFGVTALAAADPAMAVGEVLVLAVKPQQMREAVAAIAPQLGAPLLLSVAAGVRAADLSRWLGSAARIVRTMPNTPSLVGLGATGLAAYPGARDEDRRLAESIMGAVGITVWVEDESKLDAVTALSGSGPAYVFRFIEALVDGGVALGLSPEQSRRLALQTVLGAAQLASTSDEAPAVLRERVTSRGGTTAAGLAVMAERGLPATVAAAMTAACRRSEELGREFGAGA